MAQNGKISNLKPQTQTRNTLSDLYVKTGRSKPPNRRLLFDQEAIYFLDYDRGALYNIRLLGPFPLVFLSRILEYALSPLGLSSRLLPPPPAASFPPPPPPVHPSPRNLPLQSEYSANFYSSKIISRNFVDCELRV